MQILPHSPLKEKMWMVAIVRSDMIVLSTIFWAYNGEISGL